MAAEFENLDGWLAYISQSHPSEIELGLNRVKAVYQKMCFDSKPSKVVVVAGTNGKGSTIALSLAGLTAMGYRCGAYTSPHISKYNERVHLLGNDASDDSLVAAFESVEAARGDIPLTYFEFGTLAAFYILFNAGLDVVLLEIGLGGRLDAVNIIDADISVITSVDIDHVEWLGNDVEKIGTEKAGVLRQGKLFLAGEDLPESVFQRAEQLQCHNFIYKKDFYCLNNGFSLCNEQGREVVFNHFPELPLPDNNILLALQIVYLLTPTFDDELICNALTKAKLTGRLERSSKHTNLYFDVGHNPHAARFLSTFVKKEKAKGYYVEVVYSALGDKDIEGVVRELAPDVDSWLIAPLNVDRAISLSNLEGIVSSFSSDIQSFDSIELALRTALSEQMALEKDVLLDTNATGKSKLVLVFGSFFTVEAAKKYLEEYE